MNRVDPNVNGLSAERLRDLAFHGSWVPVPPQEDDIMKYHKLVSLLEKRRVKNRKICLISAPQLKPEAASLKTSVNKRYQIYPHHGFLTLASAVRTFTPSWKVDIVDLHLETIRRTVERKAHDYDTILGLIPEDCDIYGVTMMFEANEVETLRCMKYLADKGLFVISGGVHATVNSDSLLKNGYCDIVIKKEGETQLCKLINLWEEAQAGKSSGAAEFQILYNMAFRFGDEIINFEDRYEDPVSLDIREDYSLIDLDEYNKYASPNIWTRIEVPKKKWATLVTNRGCRGKYVFCQVTDIMNKGVRSRSVDDIIDEILFLYRERGVRHIEIIDDDFLANHERTLELFRRWAELKLDITFSTGAGVLVISIDEEMAAAMARAGCIMTGFGIETGNEARLKTLRKPVTFDKVREACGIFKKNHRRIWLQANFILGFPNETFEELFDTFNFAKSLAIDYCQSAILTPIIGTPVYERFVDIKDKRVINSFGREKVAMHTPGRGLAAQGKTFDDFYEEVYDFRLSDPKAKPGPLEVQQFQIYFNSFINLIGSVNLLPGGMPEKIKGFTDDVLKAYPMDAVSWGVNARASRLLGDEAQYDRSVENYRKAVKNSKFWSSFFEIYDVPKHIGIAV